jgi:hypothetical protein
LEQQERQRACHETYEPPPPHDWKFDAEG